MKHSKYNLNSMSWKVEEETKIPFQLVPINGLQIYICSHMSPKDALVNGRCKYETAITILYCLPTEVIVVSMWKCIL